MQDVLEKPDDWHAARLKGIGGSDAKRIMEGDWHKLWLEKTGRQEPDDLSDVLPVQMGSWTEELNRLWFIRRTGIAVETEECAHLIHPDHPFMRANLDGRCPDPAVFEAKHVNAYDKGDRVVARYYPQLQHCMAVTDYDLAYLSVFYGNNHWDYYTVERDEAFIADLIAQETTFWWHVQDDIAPDNPDAVKIEVALDDMREVDLDALDEAGEAWPNWAYVMQPELGSWKETIDAARNNKRATDAIKKLLPEDVKLLTYNDVKVSRSRNGAVTVKEAK